MRKPQLPTADLDWRDPQRPYSRTRQRAMASGEAAWTRARTQVLDGLDLPRAWAGRRRYTLLLVGCELGHALACAWDTWRADPAAPARLDLLAVDDAPVARHDLQREFGEYHALAQAWPVLTPGWHRARLAGGGAHLTLAWGDLADTLPDWWAEVDGIVLDAEAPLPERAWTALARMAAPGARCAGAEVHRVAAQAHGFVPDGPATWAHRPRHRPSPPPGRIALAPTARTALVVGAGLAGAACAQALQREGLAVTVLEAGPTVAHGASGNPGGLFHGTLHPDDGPHARWNRAAALHLRQLLSSTPLPWRLDGLLRLVPESRPEDLVAQLTALALPADYVEALAPDAASTRSGLPLASPAWHYPGGGALAPADLVQQWLQSVDLRLNTPIDQCLPTDHGWAVLQAGRTLVQADLLVLAAGAALPRLLAPWDPGLAQLLTPQRGQVSWLDADTAARAARPQGPVAAGSYVLPLPDGRLVVGATAHDHDPEPALRPADHAANARAWQRLCGAPADLLPQQGRVAWRLLAPDRLPLVGGLVDPSAPSPVRATQASAWARRPGLVVCGAFGSRGITSSALAGELAAALALGLPVPVERGLVDALDPARFAVRALRRQPGVSKP
ncbi:FAD-dependent 5-carboxymethylaminomethyl-2-thiouridine(34) oxidoreductase MnmC [Inhella crocodyli]|uniref:FAD-dependent oxidoreductase n=1 Tax=Inhella crocodyli TaxID=2499851 RepID=A0A3S2VIB4_9BURK|nr:FAD-dependent 5-carboxymethylaminomethyl-2-thiouridine(34) oxidoreductase MnmC [Inhella crocodyli]RVT87928.1 FAD-dependent oxidoreductase [Inhella crocodyli]